MSARIDGVRLCGWYRLEEALALPEAHFPGVYLLAHFARCPKSVVASHERIIYIGETCGQTLRQRWKQFATSAFFNKAGHSGGFTYFESFPRKHRANLAVAFATPHDEEPLLTHHIRYLERRWLFRYVQAHGLPPSCNRK